MSLFELAAIGGIITAIGGIITLVIFIYKEKYYVLKLLNHMQDLMQKVGAWQQKYCLIKFGQYENSPFQLLAWGTRQFLSIGVHFFSFASVLAFVLYYENGEPKMLITSILYFISIKLFKYLRKDFRKEEFTIPENIVNKYYPEG